MKSQIHEFRNLLKKGMSKKLMFLSAAVGVLLFSCKKESPEPENPATPSDNYSSMGQFFSMNNIPMQHYTIDAVAGGSFTTPQGTVVTILPNSFVDQSGNPVTGSVTVEFKDIYKKSDMLFSQMPTMLYYGSPLKSGGEFFIRVKQGGTALKLAPNKKVEVQQPLNGLAEDTAMQPFVAVPDSAGNGNNAWSFSFTDSVRSTASNYFFSLYSFSTPADSGTWCNSDNSSFFSAYPQTILTLHPTDNSTLYQTDVFLVFKTVNSMVHVYEDWAGGNDFPYYYAPQGLQCTVVAMGVKGGKLYSSFTPVTIGNNQTVNFTLTETTTADFKTALAQLN